jgi:hypothetical protein
MVVRQQFENGHDIMRRITQCVVVLLASFTSSYSQYHNWSATVANGVELTNVHPDSIRSDSVAFSTPEGEVRWVHVDSIHSLTYNHNPTILTLSVIGGLIGGVGNGNVFDESHRFRIPEMAIGIASGFGVGLFLGWQLGHDEVVLDGLEPTIKQQVIRTRVAHRSGRVVIVQ